MASALSIERMRNVYRVAADDPAPDEVRSRLDRLAVDEVVHACRNRLVEWMNDDDPSIWLIRSLDVDLAVDASMYSAQRAGFAWGEQLALEISRMLECGPGESVVHFPNRAAYVAQWARDMAAGRALGKWYYSDFDSLRSLSQSSAITEAILRESCAREIVLRFHKEESLESVLATLTSHDADRLYRGLFSSTEDAYDDGARWVSRLLALWNGVLNSQPHAADQLRLWAAAASEWPGDADHAGLRYAIDNLLNLRSLLSQIGSKELFAKFVAEAITGNHRATRSFLAERYIHLDEGLLRFIQTASHGNRDWANFVAGTVSSTSSANRDETFLSEFGGVFLLASTFHDLQVHHAMNAASSDCSDPLRAAIVLQFLLAVRCFGADRAASAIHDRALMEFAGLPSADTLDEMAQVLKAANARSALNIVEGAIEERYGDESKEESDRHSRYFAIGSVFSEFELDADDEDAWSHIAAHILRAFARRLPGFAQSSPEYLFRNFLAGTSQLRVGKNAIEVSMGQCPLAVVLRIAGAYRTLALPWREGVEVCLLKPPD